MGEAFGSVARPLGIIALTLYAIRSALALALPRIGAWVLPPMAFCCWTFCSTVWAYDPEAAVARSYTFLQVLGMVFLLGFASSRGRGWKPLASAVVLGTVAVAIVGVASTLLGGGIEAGRLAILDADPNELGLFLSFGILLLLHAHDRANSHSEAFGCLLLTLLCSIGVILTASRGAMLAVAGGLGVHGLYRLRHTSMLKRLSFLIAVALLLVLVGSLVPDQVLERLATTGSELRGGDLNKRTDIWRSALRIIEESPLLGVGVGSFPRAVQPYFGRPFVAHNTWLSVASELGVFGLVLFLLAVAQSFWRAIRAPTGEKYLFLSLLVTWAVGVTALSWEHKKATWLVLSLPCVGIVRRTVDADLAASPLTFAGGCTAVRR